MQGADVVTVPDFQGSDPKLFEARTLLFLGSWLDHAGAARDWPLHLACIGEPPESVRRLAERCGAEISVHEPVAGGAVPTRNKLRGFDIQPRSDRILLLDVDVVTFGDPSRAPEPGPGLSVARATNHRVRIPTWERVYRSLDEEMPAERIACLRADVADRIPRAALHGEHHLEPMHPYFNTGVLLIPWQSASAFRKEWDGYLDRLAEHFPLSESANRTVSGCDQVGFSLALRHLQQDGLEVGELPHPLHANWILLMAGVLTLRETAIYHAVHLFRLGTDRANPDWLREIDLYEDFILEHVYPQTLAGRARSWASRATGEKAGIGELRSLCHELRRLVRTHLATG